MRIVGSLGLAFSLDQVRYLKTAIKQDMSYFRNALVFFFFASHLFFICSASETTLVLEKASKIKLIALDVEGVLTNGDIAYTSSGEEIKTFNIKDGLGLVLASQHDFITAIITGRASPMVERRANELKIDHVYQNVKDKVKVLKELALRYSLNFDELCYIGDDLPDIPALKAVGLSCCPSDAVDEVKEVCDWISEKPGGHGAVRELTDLLIKAIQEN